MGTLNKTIIVGNLGHDPQFKEYDGKTLCKFSVATSESYKDKEGKKVEITEWHDVEVWGGLAKVCSEYLKKGREVLVEGSYRTNAWEDEDGTKHSKKFISANNVQFMGSNKKDVDKTDNEKAA
jgi:single-strand DNA-binding protein